MGYRAAIFIVLVLGLWFTKPEQGQMSFSSSPQRPPDDDRIILEPPPGKENLSIQPASETKPLECGKVGTCRSALYPENWQPGFEDEKGRFLHDFSYAGYHLGKDSIPDLRDRLIVNVTQGSFAANSTGDDDVTEIIQAAIDLVGGNPRGGIVYLPAGKYKVKPPPGSRVALHIKQSNVVLRGDGPDKTFIFNDENYMRDKDVIRVAPYLHNENWRGVVGETIRITEDIRKPTLQIKLETLGDLKVGDWIVISADSTLDFIKEHKMEKTWKPEWIESQVIYRQIKALDKETTTITLDIPTRYYMLQRDGARVFKTVPHISEAGIENLSIGMKQWDGAPLEENYYREDRPEYNVHGAHAIVFNHVVDGWIKNVSSFRPSVNKKDYHLLSNGIRLQMSRNITVKNVHLKKPHYRGNGGNGYLFIMQGSDNLVVDSSAYAGRHNFTFGGIQTTGNVLLKCLATKGGMPSDFHMHLSPANLVDSMTIDKEYFSARRRWSADHGHGTTQSVFWNIRGLRKTEFYLRNVVETAQFGWGYVIGTSGNTTKVSNPSTSSTEPADYVSGTAKGKRLIPQSLYLDQLEKRLLR